MENNSVGLKSKLSRIKNTLKIKDVLSRDGSIQDIAKYYKLNKLSYSIFHNKKGFVHMGISNSNYFKEENLLVQPNIVGKYIEENKATEVLELAMGKGANSTYLAKKYPNTNFYGSDLENGQLEKNAFKNINNLQVRYSDYHTLDSFPTEKFDIVFVIEALCYSNNKEIVAREVYKILKNGGIFIVIDGYSNKRIGELNKDELLAKQVTEKGMMVSNFEYFNDVKDKIKSVGFNLIEERDYSRNIIPSLERFEKLAARTIFKSKVIGKIVNSILPNEITFNAVSGYLMPSLVEDNIFCYKLLIFKK